MKVCTKKLRIICELTAGKMAENFKRTFFQAQTILSPFGMIGCHRF